MEPGHHVGVCGRVLVRRAEILAKLRACAYYYWCLSTYVAVHVLADVPYSAIIAIRRLPNKMNTALE